MAKQILGKVAYVSKGDYNNELFYEVNDVVTYNGSSYVALGNTLGNIPTNTSYWQLLAQKGDTYTVSEEDLNIIKQEIVDDANNDFNQNVNSKTEEFDTHVETKTSEFDTHVQEKTDEFDTNAAEYDERITQNTEDIAYNFARTNKNFQDSLEYKGAWGNDLTFEDSIEFPLGKLDMDGKSEQFTTTGIQMFNPDTEYPISKAGLTITKEDDGAIVINGTSTDNMNFNLTTGYSQEEQEQMNGKTYTIVVNTSGTGTLDNAGLKYAGNSNRIVIPNIEGNNNYNKTSIYTKRETDTVSKLIFTIYVLSGVTFNNMKLYFNLYEGEYNEDKVYEPYTGGQPSPSPDYPQEINSIEGDLEFYDYGSDNIFDGMLEIGTINSLTGLEEPYSIAMRSKNYMNVINNRMVYVISEEANTFGIRYYDKYYNYLGRNSYASLSNFSIDLDSINVFDKTSYYKSNEDITYMKFIITTSTDTNLKIAFNVKEKKYVPYKGHTLTIPTNGQVFRKVGDVADKLVVDMKTGDYYKEGNIGEFDYNGSTNKNISSTGLVATTIGEDLLAGVFIINNTIPNSINKPISNKFSTKVLGNESDNENKDNVRFFEGIAHHSTTNRQFIISIKKSRLNTADLDGFIQYFSNNPIKIQCALETPTLEKLGTLTKEQLDMLVTFKGYNNLMINTNLGQADINIEYVLDMKKYYNNILYNNTLSGNNIVFDNGLESSLGKLDMDGKSEQVTTTGSQLFDVSDNNFSPSSVTYDDEGWITINYTNTSDSERYANVYTNISEKLKPSTQYNVILEVKDFTNAQGIGVVTVNQQNKGQFATSYTISSSEMVKGKKYSKICTTLDNFEGCATMLRTFLTFTPSGVMSNTITFRISVIEDISVTTENFVYEPYTEKQPSPSPDYPQEITSIEGDLEYIGYGSKNIFDENWTQGYFSDNLGGTNTSNVGGRGTNKYYIGTNKKAYVLFNVKKNIMLGRFWLQQFDKDKNSIVRSTTGIYDTQLNAGFHRYEINLDENTRYVSPSFYLINDGDTPVNFANFKNYIDNVSISTTSIEYEPYKGHTLTIPTNGQVFRKVGDVADKLIVDMKTGDYYKEKNIEEIILNGSESWSLQSINEYGIANFSYRTGKENYPINFYVISNYFASQNTSISQTKTNGVFMQWQNELYIRIEQEKASTIEEFKQWLSTHNTVVDYQLNNPTLEKIGRLSSTDLNKLRTFKGYNDISINTNMGQADIEVEYVLDIKKYIDEKVAEISEQLIQ